MATYCTQVDIENVFGRFNVAKWSNLDNDSSVEDAANAARVNEAIAWASGYVEDRLRSRFSIPLSGPALATRVNDWCAKLAGVWLYEARGLAEAMETDYRAMVNGEINAVLSGMVRLDLANSGSRVSTAPYAC